MARVSTVADREIVIDSKVNPIGDKPRNKPISPVNPKLRATDNTNFSTKSSLFLPKNNMSTRQ